jgi:hypothetical protein
VWLSLPFRIRKVPLSNLSPKTNYAFRGFTSFLKQIPGEIPQTSSQQLPATFPPFHCSLLTPPLNPTRYKLLTASLNNRQLRSFFIFLGLSEADGENYDPLRPRLTTIDTPYIIEDVCGQQQRCVTLKPRRQRRYYCNTTAIPGSRNRWTHLRKVKLGNEHRHRWPMRFANYESNQQYATILIYYS